MKHPALFYAVAMSLNHTTDQCDSYRTTDSYRTASQPASCTHLMAALATASSRTILLQAAAAGISPGFRKVCPMKLSPLGLTRPPWCACKGQQCVQHCSCLHCSTDKFDHPMYALRYIFVSHTFELSMWPQLVRESIGELRTLRKYIPFRRNICTLYS